MTEGGDLRSASGRVILWRRVAFQSRHGDGAGWAWTFQDETFSLQLASSLQDAEHWLRVFEAQTDGIVLELDSAARIAGIWATDTTRFLQQPDAALEGSCLADAVGAVGGAVLEPCVRRVLATGQPEDREYDLDVRGERRVAARSAPRSTSIGRFSSRSTWPFRRFGIARPSTGGSAWCPRCWRTMAG